MPWVCALLALAFLCLEPRSGGADPHPNLIQARREFMNQNHDRVIELIKSLLEPRSVLASEEEEAEAYEMLGISYWWLNDLKAAEASFLVLLSIKPEKKLNPAIHPAGVVKFFNAIREALEQIPQEIRTRQTEEIEICRKQLARTREEFRKIRETAVETTIIQRPLWLSFIPFGVGQFNNGHTAKGWTFFSIETALLLANMTSYILAETSWVRNGPGSTVRNDEKSIRRARNVQIAQITTGSLLIGVAAAGIIEALISYRSRTVKTRPIEIPEAEPAAAGKKNQVNWRIYPSPLRGGGAVELSIGF